MKKFFSAAVLAGLFFVFMVSTDSFARMDSQGWRQISHDVYLNTKSIAHLPNEKISLWVKIVPENGTEAFADTEQQLKENGKDPRAYGYTGLLCEIDCVSHRYREVSTIFYKKDKNIIYSLNDSAAPWKLIDAQSVFDDVRLDVCGRSEAVWQEDRY